MKSLTCITFIIFSSVLYAQEEDRSNDASDQLGQVMGLEQLMQEIMKQNEDALRDMVRKSVAQMVTRLPPLTSEEQAELIGIMDRFALSVVQSVDANEAVRIYLSIVSENLSKSEVKGAVRYYKSPAGRNVLQTTSRAAKAMNAYISNQQGNAMQLAQPTMMNEITLFKKKLEQRGK